MPVVRAGIPFLAALANGTTMLAEHKRPLPQPQGSSSIGLAQGDSVVRNFGLVNDLCLRVSLAYPLGHHSPGGRSAAALRENYSVWFESRSGHWRVSGLVCSRKEVFHRPGPVSEGLNHGYLTYTLRVLPRQVESPPIISYRAKGRLPHHPEIPLVAPSLTRPSHTRRRYLRLTLGM